jgi:DNA helicase-2/ATP-dependent DNA helicase PcrA
MEILIFLIIIYIFYKIYKKNKNKYLVNKLKQEIENIEITDILDNKMTNYPLKDEENYNFITPEIDNNQKKKVTKLKSVILNLEKNLEKTPSKFIDCGYKIKYQNELNPEQLNAVMTISGKTLVIAGAGSGKTKTLTYRTSYLLENNISAEKILILTFTKKAAKEIKMRVNQLLKGDYSNSVMSGTFHSFCNMLLSKYSKMLNINPKFTILDQEDSRDLIDLLKKANNFEKKEDTPFPKKAVIQNIISSSRNKVIPIEEIIVDNYPNFECYMDDILKLAHLYKDYKKENNLYDYDDLIDEIIYHLKENKNFKESIQKHYQYIMVDEYQDTNIPQKEFIDLLAQKDDCSLMVVGDDNQSIYAFRGANYENILLFGKSYPNAKLIKLEQNYRSTPNVLNFINGISNKISLGYKKNLFSTDKIKGNLPEFIRTPSEEHEAKFIADKIMNDKERIEFDDIAILCRTSIHSNFIQAEFLKRQIPFILVGGLKFIEKRHVKDILAYMKILWNPLDTISWHRVLTLLDRIGGVTATKITNAIKEQNGEFSPLDDKSLIKKNENIKLLYDALIEAKKSKSLINTFDIIERYYIPLLKKLQDDWKTRIEDFKVLKGLCSEYDNLESFLSNLALDPPNDSKAILTPEKSEEHAVTISTIHSAKGLEWNTVFVISLIDGAVPHYKSFDNFEQLEEERKLFYVACSRAKENLYLTAPSYFSTYAAFFDKKSRFISEVDKKYYEHKNIFE